MLEDLTSTRNARERLYPKIISYTKKGKKKVSKRAKVRGRASIDYIDLVFVDEIFYILLI